MVINIRTTGKLLPEELSEKLNTLEIPAILLDKELKVIARNTESAEFASFLRKGAKINRYLPEGDGEKVLAMNPCETFITSIKGNQSECRVNIVCGVNCRLVIFQPYQGKLNAEVLDKYKKMSGYDTTVELPRVENEPAKGGKRLASGMSEIIETVILGQSGLRGLPFFNSAVLLKSLLSEMANAAPRYSERIKLSLSSDELITEGSDKDFVLMAAFMMLFCLDCSTDGEVSADAKNIGGELVFSVSCKADSSVYGIAKLTSIRKSFRTIDPEFSESDFLIYMLKLLADGNLWDLNIGYGIDGRLDFTVRAPYVKSGEEFMVRDISGKFLQKLVAELFSEQTE